MKAKKIVNVAMMVMGLLAATKAEAGWLTFKSFEIERTTPVLTIPMTLAPITGVRTIRSHAVTCENCTGPGGESQLFQCPINYVVTGIEGECAWYSIGRPSWHEHEEVTLIVHGLKIVCSPLTVGKVDSYFADVYASTFPDDNIVAGTIDGPREDPDDIFYYRGALQDACLPYTGAANGLFGRNGGRLDSVGLFCGQYSSMAIASSDIKSKTYHEGDGAGFPGYGGSPFEVKCGEHELMTGIQLRSGVDVDGIEGIVCSEIEGVR